MTSRCPVDGHELVRRSIDGRPIGSCRHCHGLWISGPAASETQLSPERIPLESRRAIPQPPDAGPRHCPQCAQLMRSERHSGLTIERCPTCRSAWLDAGEFDAVRLALLKTAPVPESVRPMTSGGWTAWELLGEAAINVLPMFLDG
jgi:Zn-finger nucleic acid-binding protein